MLKPKLVLWEKVRRNTSLVSRHCYSYGGSWSAKHEV